MRFTGTVSCSGIVLVLLACQNEHAAPAGGGLVDVGPPPDTNHAPVAVAQDRTTVLGNVSRLDGTSSFDPDGDPLTFSWSAVALPGEEPVALADETTPIVSFTPERRGVYGFRLTVSDGRLESEPITAYLSVRDGGNGPTANAGEDIRLPVGLSTTLNGSASINPAGGPLTYEWTVLRHLGADPPRAMNMDTVAPTLEPSAVGEVVVALTVSDGVTRSAPDVARITALPREAPDLGRGRFDPAEVYSFASLRIEHSLGFRHFIVHHSNLRVGVAGRLENYNFRNITIAPDGRLLFIRADVRDGLVENRLVVFHCAGCPSWHPGAAYPPVPERLDTFLDTPPCDPTDFFQALGNFRLSPDGHRIHSCGPMDQWYTATGGPLPGLMRVLSYGTHGKVLQVDPALLRGSDFLKVYDLATKEVATVTGLPVENCHIVATRAGRDGSFLIADLCIPRPMEFVTSLWDVDSVGVARLRGQYPPDPVGLDVFTSGSLRPDGTLYQAAETYDITYNYLLRRNIDGDRELVYQQDLDGLVWIEVQHTITGP